MTDSEAILCPEKNEVHEKKSKIIFVCTGNTCRSPMAAALFNHLYSDSPFTASSAGLCADGSPIAENALEALMERGVLPTPDNDYVRHTSRMLDEDTVRSADLIVGMTSSHSMSILMMYPMYASKIAVMPTDISDPYGGSIEEYRRCLSEIESALKIAFAKEKDDGNAD